jgi:hypothetical protein
MATFIPALAKARAMPSPIPEAPPVINALFPSNSFINHLSHYTIKINTVFK